MLIWVILGVGTKLDKRIRLLENMRVNRKEGWYCKGSFTALSPVDHWVSADKRVPEQCQSVCVCVCEGKGKADELHFLLAADWARWVSRQSIC